jgi:uncharacterized membrane protein
MNKFVVVVLQDETKAYQAVRELNELHQEGMLTVFATVVARREADGTLRVKQKNDAGPIGLGVGAVLGALVGVFAGPVGAAIGLAAGSVAGGSVDILQAGVSHEFTEDVKRDLTPGKFAVIAEVSEDWLAPLDTRMEALGGSIIRERRVDFVDEILEKKASSRKAEFAQWKTERASEKADRMQARLTVAVERAKKKLEHTAGQAQQRLAETKQELQAKLHTLELQAAKAKPETKVRIGDRILELRSDFAEREKKLNRAYDLAREALAGSSKEARP